ncbi:hypothetical protein EDC01DRAFT_645594 [Geopyxis carbonaria]|nr:hypothetical protein EDC01DRAFT_645594 [Geopyxis carbonaria]
MGSASSTLPDAASPHPSMSNPQQTTAPPMSDPPLDPPLATTPSTSSDSSTTSQSSSSSSSDASTLPLASPIHQLAGLQAPPWRARAAHPALLRNKNIFHAPVPAAPRMSAEEAAKHKLFVALNQTPDAAKARGANARGSTFPRIDTVLGLPSEKEYMACGHEHVAYFWRPRGPLCWAHLQECCRPCEAREKACCALHSAAHCRVCHPVEREDGETPGSEESSLFSLDCMESPEDEGTSDGTVFQRRKMNMFPGWLKRWREGRSRFLAVQETEYKSSADEEGVFM